MRKFLALAVPVVVLAFVLAKVSSNQKAEDQAAADQQAQAEGTATAGEETAAAEGTDAAADAKTEETAAAEEAKATEAKAEETAAAAPAADAAKADAALTEEQLVALFDNKANGLVILDTRDAQSFAQARLQGAVNAPAGEIAPQALRDLVASAPKASVVIFCQDAECKGAEKVASAAAEAGIAKEQIRTFKADTLENLQARGLPVDESESTNTRS